MPNALPKSDKLSKCFFVSSESSAGVAQAAEKSDAVLPLISLRYSARVISLAFFSQKDSCKTSASVSSTAVFANVFNASSDFVDTIN
jgi:hypothetical protein